MDSSYDAIVIGARCAGSPTAMLLAQRGHRVLLVDKASFPSDTMSTHLIHPPGVAALTRWGLYDKLASTGCPPISTYSFDFGPVTVSGNPRPVEGNATAFGPRRHVLDAILVEAAVAAGAELRENFSVDEILFEDDRVTGIRGRDANGTSVSEHARVVVGADGKHSLVAKTVQAEEYDTEPTLEAPYYAYWSGLPASGFEAFDRAQYDRGWAAIPTHDDLTCVVVGTPRAQFGEYRRDIEGTYMGAFEHAPEFAERIAAATRESRFVGTGDLPNFLRVPFGPGWALVGDAGYHKDPITAFGISDAFRDAELLADALDAWLEGRRDYAEALASYQLARDADARPVYVFTRDFAKLEPAPPEMQHLFGAMQGNQQAMNDFVSVMAGTLSPPDFFSPENTARIFAQAEKSATTA